MNGNGNGGSAMEIYAKLIRDVGFPIAVAGVLLWFMVSRLDPAIAELSRTIRDTTNDLRAVMSKQVEAFDKANKIGEENNERLRQMMGDSTWRRDRRETTR